MITLEDVGEWIKTLGGFVYEFFQISLFSLPDGTVIGLWVFPLILAIIFGILGIGKFLAHLKSHLE